MKLKLKDIKARKLLSDTPFFLSAYTNSAEHPHVDCHHKIAIKISHSTLDALLANNGVYGMS